MNRKQARKAFRTMHASEITPVKPDITQAANIDESRQAARNEAELSSAHNDPENNEILLAACGIVISGYRSEISRGHHDSLFVQAAYQLLHSFLEHQFKRNSRAA